MNDLVERKQLDLEPIFLKAIEKDASVDTIERLMAMHDKIKADWAKEQYYAALSKFQSMCPIIEKKRIVKKKNSNEIRYKYASLDDIIEQVSPLLEECGLSYTIKTEHKDGAVIAYCVAHHLNGHSDSASFFSPIDKEAFMNDAQKAASAQTYAKRYAFCNVFGIMTGDVDDDVKSLGQGQTIQDVYKNYSYLMAAVLDNYSSIETTKRGIQENKLGMAAEAWFELDDKTKKTLWVAPTKGGPFTTKEREVMKSSEFAEAFYGPREEV